MKVINRILASRMIGENIEQKTFTQLSKAEKWIGKHVAIVVSGRVTETKDCSELSIRGRFGYFNGNRVSFNKSFDAPTYDYWNNFFFIKTLKV